ncbi:type II toxin-antitoxin system VapC family toxin [Candidatus Leptofilum sp.]|uniref:type II toxin-antitoxin system VapC family toxin n=1 Tax=Candidatus Leptofilum sp. TaxID=3241576 RepID=UPI003B5997D0
MKALLDTHTFLWWNMDSPKLSAEARKFIGNGRNQIYLSAATAWEIAIKFAKGRLSLPESPELYVATRLQQHNFLALPIQMSHALAVAHLPDVHQDPFDRLLIAQSQIEKLPLLTVDAAIHQYPVETIW